MPGTDAGNLLRTQIIRSWLRSYNLSHTRKSMQPFRRYSCLKHIARMRQTRECSEIFVNDVNMQLKRTFFHILSSSHIHEQPCRWKLLYEKHHRRISSFKIAKSNFSRCFHVLALSAWWEEWWEGVKLEELILVSLESPHGLYPLSQLLSIEEISIFWSDFLQIAKT